MSTEAQDAQNLIDAARQSSAQAKGERDQAAAQAGNKTGEGTPLAFAYDPAAAEQLFGRSGEDGRPANIPAKYWDPAGRKVKADVMFSQLKWTEGKLGEKKLALMGGPADGDYKINVPKPSDGGDPFEIPNDDPAVKALLAVAKKHDVSQGFIDEVIGEVVKNIEALQPVNFKAEMTKLGANADARLTDMADFLTATLPKEHALAITNLMTSADAFNAIEALVKASGAPNFIPKDPLNDPSLTANKITVEEWNALNFEMVDQGGQQVRRRAVDPAFNAKVEALAKEVFGEKRRDASGREVTASGQPVR